MSNGVLYARYSSHAQRDVSIEQQIRECRQFAKRNGIDIVHIYEDRALSGTSDNRPGFQQMIKDSARHEWDYVIVYTLDRFARDRYDSAVYKRTLKNNGVRVLSAMENISDDPTGILMESVLEGLAEYYSKELSRKIRRGMDDNARKCMAVGPLSLGYVRCPDGRYAIEPNEAEIVKEVFARIADGTTMADLIREFNLRGIRTKRGGHWNKTSFSKMLSNERYIGTYIYKGNRIPGGVPAIISEELFYQVQNLLHNKPNPRQGDGPQRRRRENGIYLLTGKLYCGECHEPMIGISGHSKTGSPYYYYVCKGKRFDKSCDKRNVPREYIERQICQHIKDHVLKDEMICKLADAAIAYQDAHFSTAEADNLRDRLADVRKSLKNLISAIEAGIFTQSTQKRLNELEEEERLLSGQLSIALQDAEKRLSRKEIIAALKLFQNGDVDDKDYQESLIDAFLVRAYVYDNKLSIIFNLDGSPKNAEIPFDIDAVSFSDTSTEFPRLHHSLLYEHSTLKIIMIGELFVLSCDL